jgi:hypothetical protein
VVSVLNTVRVVVGLGACVEIYATHFLCNPALTNPPFCSHSPISAISHNTVYLPNPLLPHSVFDGVQEVVGVLLSDVLNSKVVCHHGEDYRTRFVTPQAVCVFIGVVTMRC